MTFEILEEAKKSGVTTMKFCGVELEGNIMCPEEASGELQVEADEGMIIPIPICERHLQMVSVEYGIS